MIRVSRSVLGPREQAAVADVLERGYLGQGPEVEAFEAELGAFLGAPAVCTHTGTSALHLAMQALGLGPGDEVLVPSITYVATPQAVLATGATPILCDVHPNTGLLCLEDAKARITARTRAILPVHYAGSLAIQGTARAFAASHGLAIVEDAAHAFGCAGATPTGRQIVCYSFDGIKNITSGEGGAVVTADPELRARVRAARKLGLEPDGRVQAIGWRYHMSDLMAAIGRVQLTRLPSELAPARRALARRYLERLPPHVTPMLQEISDGLVPHIFPVRLPARDAVRGHLTHHGVQTGFHYPPNHRHSLFTDGQPRPGAEALASDQLTLPLHPGLSVEDVDFVCRLLEVRP